MLKTMTQKNKLGEVIVPQLSAEYFLDFVTKFNEKVGETSNRGAEYDDAVMYPPS